MTLQPGFVKGSSGNLPKIDAFTMFGFFGNNPDFLCVELKQVDTYYLFYFPVFYIYKLNPLKSKLY